MSATSTEPHVVAFGAAGVADPNRLGGKGASLVKMVGLGMPVPPGFVLSTEVGRGYLDDGALSEAVVAEVEAQLQSPLMKQSPEGTNSTPLSAFAATVLANVAQTFEAVAPTEFEAILTILTDTKRRLHVVGGRLTEAVALYTVRHLRIIRPEVTLVANR